MASKKQRRQKKNRHKAARQQSKQMDRNIVKEQAASASQRVANRIDGKKMPVKPNVAQMKTVGIKHVPGPVPENAYTGSPVKQVEPAELKKAQLEAFDVFKQAVDRDPVDLPFDINVGTSKGMSETARALADKVANNKKGMVYDIENLGVMPHHRVGDTKDYDIFHVTELSMYIAGGNDDGTDVNEVLINRLDEATAGKLGDAIKRLEHDPRAFYDMDEHTRRTISHLALYADEKNFTESTIGGNLYKTLSGQDDAPDYTTGAMVKPEFLSKYQKGLANLTNPALTNSPEQTIEAFNFYAGREDITLIGQNNQNFDRHALFDLAKGVDTPAARKLEKKNEQPQIDILPLSGTYLNEQDIDVENYQLGTVFNFMNKDNAAGADDLTAHFSGDDGFMTNFIAEQFEGKYRAGDINVGQPLNIKPGDQLHVKRGTGRYYASDFNRNKGQHDITLRYNGETNEWTPNYDFKEPTVTGNQTLEFNRDLGWVDIDEHRHRGLLFEDKEQGVFKVIFREDVKDFGDLFTDNLQPAKDKSPEQVRLKKNDDLLRRYNELWEVKSRREGDNIPKRLDKAYNTLDVHDRARKEAFNELKPKWAELLGDESFAEVNWEDFKWDDLRKDARYEFRKEVKDLSLKKTMDELNAGKAFKDPHFSRKKASEYIEMEHQLKAEKPLYDAIKKELPRVERVGEGRSGFANDRVTSTFARDMKDVYDSHVNASEVEYPAAPRSIMIPKTSAKGELTAFSLESKEKIASRVRQTVRVDETRGKGPAKHDFEALLDSLGPLVDDETKTEMRVRMNRDLNKNGKPDPGTVDYIAKIVHKNANARPANDPMFVASMPGKNFHSARFEGVFKREMYPSQLSSNTQPWYDDMVDAAAEDALNSLHSTTVADMREFDIRGLSNPARQRIKRAQDAIDWMQDDVIATKKIMGLYGEEPTQILKKVSHEERIQQTITNFQKKDYNVVVDFEEDSGNMFLYFAHKDDYTQPANMSATERLYSGKLDPIVMPLTTKDASVPVGGGQYMKQNYMLVETGENDVGWAMKSTTDIYYDQVANLPYDIEKEMKKHADEGHPISRARAAENVTRRNRRRIREGGVSVKFSNKDRDDSGLDASSREKNLAGFVDTNHYVESWIKNNDPDSYAKIEKWRSQPGNQYKNISEGLWADMDTAKILANAREEAAREWNDTYYPKTGVKFSPYGMNAKQSAGGAMALIDPRTGTPFGEENSSTRDQIMKPGNYVEMDREPLDEYMMTRYGGDERRASRAFTGIRNERLDSFDNTVGEATGHKAIHLRNTYTNEQDLNDDMKGVRGVLTQRISDLESLKKTKDDAGQQAIEDKLIGLRGQLEEIDSGKFSVHEEQSIARQSLFDSIQITKTLNIDVDDNKELNDKIGKMVRKELKAEGADGDDIPLGRLMFDTPLTVKQMQDYGFVNDKKELTIGKLVLDEFEDSTDDPAPKQKKRLWDGAILEGIEHTPEGTRLLLKQRRTLDAGSKGVKGVTGERKSYNTMSDELFDTYLDYRGLPKDVDIISEHIKPGRDPRGGLFGELIQTDYRNAMDAFDNAWNGKDTELGLVSNWIDDNTETDYDTAKKAFVEDVFMKRMNDITAGKGDDQIRMSDFITLNDKGELVEVKPTDETRGLDRTRGFELYKKLYDTSVETDTGFGFNEAYSSIEWRKHNVDPYERAGHAIAMSTREYNMLLQSMTDLRDPDNMQFGEDTPIMQHMKKLSKPADDSPHLAYVQGIREVLKDMSGEGHLADIERDNNVVLDLTGKYTFKKGETVKRIKQDGQEFFAVNAFAIQEAPQSSDRTQASLAGTTADVSSFILSSEDDSLNNLTVGKLVNDNGGKAVLAIQDPDNPLYGGKVFERDYIPVVPNFEENTFSNDVIHMRETNKAFERTMNQVKRYSTLDFSKGELAGDREAQMAQLNDIARMTNEQIRAIDAGAANYFMGKSKGSFPKNMRTMSGEDAASGLSSMKNIFTEGDRSSDEIFVSQNYAKQMIQGKEAQILKANKMSIDDFDTVEDAQQAIMDRITGTRDEDDPFEMLVLANRFPTQSEGSLVFGNLRVDKAMKEDDTRQIAISRGMAKLLKADNDGDKIYLNSYLYRDIEGQETDWQAMQGQMSKVTQMFKNRGEERLGSELQAPEVPGDTFSYIAGLNPDDPTDLTEINRFFQPFNDDGAAMQQTLANSMKSPGIGMMDNTMVGARALMNWTMNTGVKEGVYSGQDWHDTMSKWDQVNNDMVENFISAKKLNKQTLANEAGITFDDMKPDEQASFILNYGDNQNTLPGMIRNLKPEGVDELIEHMDSIGMIAGNDNEQQREEEMARLQEVFGTFSLHNKTLGDSGLGGTRSRIGMNNPALGIQKGDGRQAINFIKSVETDPGRIMGTPNANELVALAFSDQPDIIKNYSTSQAGAEKLFAKNLTQNLGREQAKQLKAKDMTEQVDILNTLVKQSVNQRQARAQENIGSQLKATFSKAVKSDAFLSGAGMAAMWIAASAIKRGPTPEGNEAQQTGMAAPEEIDPSRLLTGPTARISPGAERVMLRVSGQGNADQDMVAGVLNNTINRMTGVPMQMHMDVTDNTQKLDQKFYQQTVSNALGLEL